MVDENASLQQGSSSNSGGQPPAMDVSVPAPKWVPKCEFQFAPRCNHRHPMKRHPREAGAAADEPLVCDGGCGKEIPPSDPRWSCFPCDFDLCELCLLSRSGGAVYLGLLAAEEKRCAERASELSTMQQRCKAAEERLARKEREDKAVEVKATGIAEKGKLAAAEGRAAAADERARAAFAEVARLEQEVVERRQRSKANLEKMYAAQKERDAARAEADSHRVDCEALLAAGRAEAEELQEVLATARKHVAVAQGDVDAVRALTSLEEADQLEARARAALLAIGERRATLAAEAADERQKRLDCAVCLVGARGIAFAPCGHIATCKECAPKVHECPLCKVKISSRVSVYLP